MARTIALDIISPEGSVFKNEAESVTLPGARGEITVLPDHTPLFTKLTEGEIVITQGGERTSITVTGGFVDISENKLTVLADFAIRSDEIERTRAEEAVKTAQEALKRKKGDLDIQMAEKDLKKYILELKIAERIRKKGGISGR